MLRFVYIVFAAPAAAEKGEALCVLAGPASAVQKVKPYTKGVIGRENIDLSDQPHGKATLLKVLGNTFVLNMVEALAEGHTLAETSGLGTSNLHQFIEAMFPGPYAVYSGRMIQGDYYKREDVCNFQRSFLMISVASLMETAPIQCRACSKRCWTCSEARGGFRLKIESLGGSGSTSSRCRKAFGYKGRFA